MKFNKKILLLLLMCVLALSLGLLVACDNFGTCNHVDTNIDGKCDVCLQSIVCIHIDSDKNGICDKCQKTLVCEHVDADNNGFCDNCNKQTTCKHYDSNKDNVCDLCSQTICNHVDVDGDSNCDVCNNAMAVGCQHDYTQSLWYYTHNQHWQQCTLCENLSEKVAHSGDDDGNCTTAVKCECGYAIVSAKGQHKDENLDGVCDNVGCNVAIKVPCATHDFANGIWASDQTHHWQVCANCDEISAKNAHYANDDGDCTTASVCQCGKTLVEQQASHDYSQSQWVTDGVHHWKQCANCTVTTTKQEHSGTDDGDCTTAVTCECGFVVISAKANHVFTAGVWQNDQTNHWQKCTNCAFTTQPQPHSTADDGNCTTAVICNCGHVVVASQLQHIDSDKDGICDNDNCTQTVKVACQTHDFENGVWANDTTHHWKICANCSTLSDRVTHDQVVSNNCLAEQTCQCGIVIKQSIEHDFANGTLQSNASGHWQTCANCPQTSAVTSHDAPIQTDCTKAVTCNECNYLITPAQSGHNFDGEWKTDATTHWQICQNNGCSQTSTKQYHNGSDDGDCTTAVICECGKVITTAVDTHNFGGEWKTSASGHWQLCQNENCTQQSATQSHSGSDDNNCATAVKCQCGYTITLAISHNYKQCYDTSGHWTECQNSGCTIKTTVVAHGGSDDSNCTTALTCDCGYVVTQAQSSHNYKWTGDASGHWQVCQNSGCSQSGGVSSHQDTDQNELCDTCNYSMPIESDCTHTDSNSDGSCDKCSQSVIVDIDLFGVNDLHGKFLANDNQPGVGGLTTYLKDAKQTNPNTVVFSSGDMWQGSAESGLSKGKIINDWMKEVGFAFMTLGNHEFDWGTTYIQQNVSSALPFLGINVYDPNTNQRASYAQPSVLVDFGDVQIGFIGAMGDCLSSISGEYQSQVTFQTGATLTSLVKAESERLRDNGADIIVYSIHSGSASDTAVDYDESLSNGYVDIVFEAHTHQSYKTQDSYGVWHLQAGGDNSTGIYNAEMSYNIVTNQLQINTPTLISQSTYGACAEDESIAEIKALNQEAIDKTTTVIGTNSTKRTSSFLTQLVAQLYANAGQEKWGNSYNIVLGGGKINCRSPYNLYAGNVTYGDLYMLFPFDNKLGLCSISGSNLNSRYINNSDYVCGYTDYGNTVKSSVNTSATYYIIADSYNYTYSSNKLTLVANYTEGVYARDLLADYIASGGLGSGTSGGTGSGTTGGTTTPSVTLTANAYNTIADIIAYAQTLSAGVTTTEKYYTSGKIQSIDNTTYGNMTLVDENGNTLVLWGFYSSDGTTRYDAMTTKPAVGDTIYVYGALQRYVSNSGTEKIEIMSARWVQESDVPN